jgi:mannosyltransferase OCH1-like enzyme
LLSEGKVIRKAGEKMLPKKIHFVWFGGGALSKKASKCVASWKRFCPDYEIVQWDEKTFSVSDAPLYVRQAYEAKKFAFVSDYVRLFAIVSQGGIYMDTDVELFKPLDPLLTYDAFCGFESKKYVATCMLACNKGNEFFNSFLNYYSVQPFLKPDGSFDQTTNVSVLSNLLEAEGLKRNGTRQTVSGVEVFPSEYFCALEFGTGRILKTANTYAIHRFDMSWLPKRKKFKAFFSWKLRRILSALRIYDK